MNSVTPQGQLVKYRPEEIDYWYCFDGWSFLPNALRPFKIYCAPPIIISQLVLFLWQTVEIDPLGYVRVVEAIQDFVQKCDPVKAS